jgi:4-amino-4-deoxychorismate lyase
MMLIDGKPGDRLSATDRGLAFGDGVFRTLEWINGQPRLWAWQYARLCADARGLSLTPPDECVLLAEISQAAAGLPRAVVKITLTRGSGLRGYAVSPDCRQTRIVNATPWSGYPPELQQQGVALTLCALRLGIQPRLAGIKHLNRLECVLARSEWSDPEIREGLMLDSEGAVTECTMSNLFLVSGGELLTPLLDRCGVAGAMRAWILDHAPVREARIGLDTLMAAEEVFVCNSLIGIWPVARLGERQWASFGRAAYLLRLLDTQA